MNELINIDLSPIENFLDGWVEQGRANSFLCEADKSLEDLKKRLGGSSQPGMSRTHKKIRDDLFVGVAVFFPQHCPLGVDLEVFKNRSAEKISSLAEKLGLSGSLTEEELLEEWTAREAAFKVVSQWDPRDTWVDLLSLVKRPSRFEIDVSLEGRAQRRLNVNFVMWSHGVFAAVC
jgi:hypothetical protein